ncbi:hypothetical protein FGIG_00415 [Fasciola gigantica]|uniref:DAGKc domain-containing protein n=1 Tax=Fasciola gigantica TaxID=46835 RepID=A0A504Y5I7_FASGI|nr:hypothetical protein FGIG_00415 [Fasciola gigantica]
MGLFEVVRNHPKKTLFSVAAISYLYNYASQKYRQVSFQFILFRQNSVMMYYGVTFVIWSRSLLKEFEKDVAPLLQLGGLDVQMVYTDNDFQTKDYVRVIDPQSTDGILVASDDHVLQKVVTALLERPELASGPHPMPVGIVPIGIWNAFASTMVERQNLPRQEIYFLFQFVNCAVDWCFKMVTPLLNESIRMQNVLEISTIPSTESSVPTALDNLVSRDDQRPAELAAKQTAFSLSGLEWSIWRDAEHGGGIGAPKNKSHPTDPNNHRGLLPMLSPLSFRSWTRRMGAAWRYTWFWLTSTPELSCAPILSADAQTNADSKLSFFRVNAEFPNGKAEASMVHRRVRSKYGRLIYTPACDGCSSCWPDRIRHLQPSSDPTASTAQKPASIFSQMFGLSQAKLTADSGISYVAQRKRLPVDRSQIQNPDCGREYSLELKDTASLIVALEGRNIRVEIVPTPKSFLSYMQQAFAWLSADSYHEGLNERDSYASNSPRLLLCSTVRLFPSITQNEFYWIDNDHFEACPVEVRVRINAVDFYGDHQSKPCDV